MTESDPRTAIVLLHGIGDQRQRETLDQFLGALRRVGAADPGRERIFRELPSQTPGSNYFLARTDIAGQPTTIAECYWADISRVKSGLLSILRNFFQLIVDAPDIIYACLGPRLTGDKPKDFFLLRCMRSLLAVMIWLIYFPIIAINIAYAILVGEFAISAARFPEVSLATTADGNFAIASGASVALLSLSGRLRLVHPYTRAIIFMVAGVMIAVCGFSLSNLFFYQQSVSYGQYATFFNGGLNGLWSVVTAISLVYLILVPLLCALFYKRWRSILLGFTTAFLVIRFWLALITTLWLVYLTSIFDAETYDNLITNIGGPIRFVSLVWFDVAIIGLVLGSSLLSFIARTAASEGKITGRRYPRLIIPSVLPFVAMVLAITGVMVIGACNCALILPQCGELTCGFVYEPSEWIIANAATLLALGGVLIQLAHSRFDVAIDIVNFFKSDRGHRRINPFGAIASVFLFQPDSIVSFRRRLQERLSQLLNDLNVADGRHGRTLLVGHSLGSMIAIDWLDDKSNRPSGATHYELVTMGTPYGAIFHHYFPHMFAPAARDLLPGVVGWTNVYRENDYVGTSLSDGDKNIDEVAQPPTGHYGYFSDDAVVREIAARIDKRE